MAVPKRFRLKKKKNTKHIKKNFNSLSNSKIFFKISQYI